MAKTDTNKGFSEAIKSAQDVFGTAAMMGPQGRHFWQAQERVLDEAEQFYTAWFKRRHDAVRAALDTTALVATDGMRDPSVALRALTEWQSGSMERMAQDVREGTAMVSRCMSATVGHEIEAMEETTRTAKRATKSSKSDPV